MSAMAEMSRAIRLTIERYSATGKLTNLPTLHLEDFTQITGAYYLDLKAELERRRASNTPIRPLSDEEKIAVRQKWLDELYVGEGAAIWIAHAEKQGWDIDYQLQRLEQLVTGAYA